MGVCWRQHRCDWFKFEVSPLVANLVLLPTLLDIELLCPELCKASLSGAEQ